MPVKHHNDDNGKYHKTTVTLTAEPKSNRLSAFHQPTSLEVYSYGATIGSWKVDGTEKLFLSEKAILNGTKAIRGGYVEVYGGIPLVFPQFGSKVESQLPQHGFARCSFWKFGSVVADTAEAATVTFILDQSLVSPELVEMWPHKFELVYTITLSSRTLKTELKVVNKDEKEWSFECLLHTYFLVKNLPSLKISSLQDLSYVDKTRSGLILQDKSSVIKIAEETDRVYANTPDVYEISDDQMKFEAKKWGLKDTVVWNPWVEKAKKMSDFKETEYQNMVCVEFGNVAKPVVLQPGESWEGGQLLSSKM